MSDTERAINKTERSLADYNEKLLETSDKGIIARLNRFCRMEVITLQALREKDERDKGCEYCRDGKVLSGGKTECSWIEDDKLYWHTDEYGQEELASLDYCFKCGSKLGGDERG